jgi:O-antigen/teichoic acid export membrane protein
MRLPLMLSPRRIRQLWYAPLLALAMGLVMLRILAMARLLDVHAFAAFSGAILISSTFCMVGCLGLQSMLQREWPVLVVRGQELRAVVGAAQCNLLAIASAAAFCLCAVSGLSVAGMGPQLLVLGVVHGAAQQAFLVATTESRSRGDTLEYAGQQLARAGLSLVTGTVVAVTTSSPIAVIAAEAIVSTILSLIILRASMIRVALGWRAAYRLALRRMPRLRWRSALTMMAVMLVAFLTLNADRWIASRLLSPAGFAEYSFVAILLAVAQALQALINASVYPLLARRFATLGHAVTFKICLRASAISLVLGALAFVPTGALLKYSVARWYPQYSEAIGLIPLLLVVGVLRVSDFWSSYLLITGYERRLLVLNGATVVCATLVWLAWTTPWRDAPTSLWDIGLLATLLSLFSNIATAGAAWRVQRP